MTHDSRRGVVIALVLGLAAMAGCQTQPATRGLADAEAINAAEHSPAAVYLELATSYLEQGQAYAALTNARKAIATDPDNSEARIIKAMAESRLGYSEEAEKSLQELLARDPDDPYAVNAYGTLLCGERRYAEAVVQFDKAVANPRNQAAWVALTNAGLCLREQGNAAQAAGRFERALQKNSRFGPALLALARLTYDQRKAAEARGYISRYFEVSVPDPESLLLAYQIEKSLGNANAADSYALMLKSRFPEAPQTYRLLGL